MYLKDEKDKIRAMLTGTPLSAEKIRMSGQRLGLDWYGTSWFFLMHIMAKALSRNELITFNGLCTITKDYEITSWENEAKLKYILDKITHIFIKSGLTNITKDDNCNVSIDGSISKKELYEFTQSQYDYSMTDGLVQYDSYLREYFPRGISNNAERVFWHYITGVYDCPQLYQSKYGDFLTSTTNNVYDNMSGKYESHGFKLWDNKFSNDVKNLVKNWERNLVSKNILYPLKFDDNLFIAPSFYAEIDLSVFENNVDKKTIFKLIDTLRKFPSYPIYKGDEEKYDLAKRLQRSGAIQIVEEEPSIANHYVYLVSRDIFDELDKDIKFNYSQNPLSEFGDSSLTQDIFTVLGRARLLSEKKLPLLKFTTIDYQKEIERVFSELENRGESSLGPLSDVGIFQPFLPLNITILEDKKLYVQEDWIIKKVSDYYFSLINDPDLSRIEFPPKKSIKQIEKEQTKMRIKKKTESLFIN